MFTICGETLRPGEKRQLFLRVPMDGLPHAAHFDGRTDGDYEIPATLICGAKPGTTLLVTASIHAGEYVGIPAAIDAANRIDPAELAGNLILMHSVNASGNLSHHYRTVPEDGFNLNNGYPGRADGSVGERIAAWFVREIFSNVDFIFDLHGGSPEEVMTPLVFFPNCPKVREAALAAAKSLSLRYALESVAQTGEYSYAANALGIPGLLMERGNGLYCTAEDVREETDEIFRLLDHLAMLPYDAAQTPTRVFRESVYLEADRRGLWYPAVQKDTDVRRGDPLGVITDYFGRVLREYFAEDDGRVVYYTQGLAVEAGDALVAYCLLRSEL